MIETPGALLERVARHGLWLSAEGDEYDESGADFRVLQARDPDGRAWVVRSPRRNDVMRRAEVERRVLSFLRGRLPVVIPEWRVFDDATIAYPRLHGEPAASVDLAAGGYVWRFDPTHAPEPFFESLGAALAALHGIDVEEALAARVPAETAAEAREGWRSLARHRSRGS